MGSAFAGDVYFALGDSIAEGFQPTDIAGAVRTNGDRGYVSYVADRIGVLQGARPTVVNLAIPGETSSSWFDTSNPFYYANSNYPLPGVPRSLSQGQLFSSLLASHLGGGDTVKHVSIAFGANDLLDILDDPNFASWDDLTRQAHIAAALQGVANRYAVALNMIRTALPTAQILMPGFYNPYPAGTPFAPIGDSAVGALNSVIQTEAGLFGGTYVDFFSPIQGNQASLTWITDPIYHNIHPNDAGYAVLGEAAAAKVAAVPEPTTLAALGIGLLCLRRRRQK